MPTFDTSSDLQQELSFGQKFVKYIIVFFNVIFLIFGGVLIAVGVSTMNAAVMTLGNVSLPIGLIVIGAFLLLMAIIGGLSAWFEIRLGLGIYFILLLLLSIVLIAVGIAVFVEKNNASVYINNGWKNAGVGLRTSLQNSFSCCGLNSWGDSWSADYSTCTPPDTTCNCPTSSLAKNNGGTGVACGPVLQNAFYNNFNTAGICGIVFSVVMFLTLFFICYLMIGIRTVDMHQKVAINREKTERDKEKRRKKGGGLKRPDVI